MGMSINDLLMQDPEYVQRQLYQQEMQRLNPQNTAGGALGALLGRGLGNVVAGRGFFEISDPTLQKASQLQSIFSNTMQSFDPANPVAAYENLAKQLASAGFGPQAAQVAQQAFKLKKEAAAESRAERGLVIQEEAAQDTRYRNNPELLIEDARALPDDDPRKQSLINRYYDIKQKQKLDIEKTQAEINAWNAKALASRAEKPRQLTAGQRALDTTFAKEYNDYISGGGSATVEKNLKDIDRAIKILEENPNATGRLAGAAGVFGDTALAQAFPIAAEAKDLVGGVAQSNLRQILGGQFAAKEGEALLARAYNISAPTADNLRRLKNLKKQIVEAAKAKEAAGNYFETEGTLVGFRGTPFYSVSPVETEKPKPTGGSTGGSWEILKVE